ncbi:MAG: phage holin family protein [Pirellula sp.]
MVDIEKMNGKYRHSNLVGDIKSTAGAFACDLLELAELQGKLFRADAKTALHQSKGSAAAIIIACCCLLACLPVAGFGLASAVAYYFQWEEWVAQLAVGGCLSILSIVVAAISFKNVTRANQFKRSSEEFSKNLEWTKRVFDGDSAR